MKYRLNRNASNATAPPWYSQPPRPQLGRMGAMGSGAALVATDTISFSALGAKAGSVVPGVGTAIGAGVGAVVGAVVGVLSRTNNTASHIGGWDGGLTQAIGGLPTSAAGIGRQIPWNENSHGLVQMIEALLATGVYMAWDTSLKTNYDVAAHWAMTFGQAVQNLAQAIVAGQSSVSIPLSPGAGGHPPFTFNFTNPGVQVGPDKIAATLVMGPSGLMGAMMTALGGQAQANIISNENNALAQKVYALMLDYWFAQLVPAAAQPTTPTPVIAPAVAAASAAANAAAAKVPATATIQPVPTPPPPPTAVPSAVIAAQPQIQQAPAPNIVVNVPEQQPQMMAAPTATGMSTNTLLLIGGVALAAILLLKK